MSPDATNLGPKKLDDDAYESKLSPISDCSGNSIDNDLIMSNLKNEMKAA